MYLPPTYQPAAALKLRNFNEFGPCRPMKPQEHRFHEELLTRLASPTSFSITQLFQITRCPFAVFIYVLIIRYEIMHVPFSPV